MHGAVDQSRLTRSTKQLGDRSRMDFQKRYGIKINPDLKPVQPILFHLVSGAGRRLVLETEQRVIATHADMLAAPVRC